MNIVDVINELGAWHQFMEKARVYGDFKAAGGLNGVKLDPQTSYNPLMMHDISGGVGIQMQGGDEFWKLRLQGDPHPSSFNVQIRKRSNEAGDTVLEYKYGGSDWTRTPPPLYDPPRLPAWLRPWAGDK